MQLKKNLLDEGGMLIRYIKKLINLISKSLKSSGRITINQQWRNFPKIKLLLPNKKIFMEVVTGKRKETIYLGHC